MVIPAVAGIVWDSTATGGVLHDEESFVTALQSVGIPVDTLSVSDLMGSKGYNLLIVPYSSAEKLSDSLYDAIERFVSNEGKLITNAKIQLPKTWELSSARMNSEWRKCVTSFSRKSY